MARSFKIKHTKEELEKIIMDDLTANEEAYGLEPFDEDEVGEISYFHDGMWGLVEHNKAVSQDISKIDFNLENFGCDREDNFCQVELGFITLYNGFTFLGCNGGGDWEVPVYFIIYHDGKKLRGYIPSKGNSYNKRTKQAREGEWDGECDELELFQDIENRIKYTGK